MEYPGNLLPTTVLMAIVLFLVKELVEISRKRKAKQRKLGAFKAILAEELERNYWAWHSLKRGLANIQGDLKENADYTYEVRRNASGAMVLRSNTSEGEFSSIKPLPEVYREAFTTNVVEIAEIDDSLYQLARIAYDEVAEIAHVRTVLVNELSEDEGAFLSGAVDYGIDTLESALPSIQTLYRHCTGKDLTSYKLR